MWSVSRSVVAGVALSLALSGAGAGVQAAEPVAPAAAGFDPVADGAAVVQQANWDAMQAVEVRMSEYKYEPAALVFKSGQPYKLVLRNVGKEPHYFTAPAFFKAVASRKVQSRDAEIKAYYFNAFEVLPGGSLEFFFVPVTKGDFALCCTMKGHKENGMVGTIKVE